jgi:hypothetical protein
VRTYLRRRCLTAELQSRELIGELGDCEATMVNEAEMMGVRRHGHQIIQTIFGDRYQHFGCEPAKPDFEVPDEVEAKIV